MNSLPKWQKILTGLGAATGAIVYYINLDKTKVYNSWTSNYTLSSPAAKWDENWDRRAPGSLVHPHELKNELNTVSTGDAPPRKPKAIRNLLLIRHGQYEIDGKSDEERVLTAAGRTQAAETAKRLKELGLPYTDMIKSTMSRAQETGNIILTHLPEMPVKDCHLLREGAPVPPEPPVGHWKPEVHQFYRDGPRIEAAFRQYFYRADASQEKDSFTLLVCHANVIRYFVCRALQFPPEAWLRLHLSHASVTWIAIMPSGRVVLRALGDIGHMPPHLVTSNRTTLRVINPEE